MQRSPIYFVENAREALQDSYLQTALGRAKSGFIEKRRKAIDAFPDFERARDQGVEIKNHTLANLPDYLDMFETNAIAAGANVVWAENAVDACSEIVNIASKHGAKLITKGKSMAGEELQLNEALEAANFDVVETDLGEYIIQLAHEPPSHIIAPAVHKTRGQIADLFLKHHENIGFPNRTESIPELVDQARQILRQKYVDADIGITGANFLIAETGSTVIVTNEGNGDLTAGLPKVHIVIASIEKVVPSLRDATLLLRLLGRSATGQAMSAYTTFFTGPKRDDDLDGPEHMYIVLVDNGRSLFRGQAEEEMLRCIKCGACMNHCPVYSAIGGHAYGWVYPGPMGSVLTPLLHNFEQSTDLPSACTLNGRCAEVCPVKISLPSLLRNHRKTIFTRRLKSLKERLFYAAWRFAVKRPSIYRFVSRCSRTGASLFNKYPLLASIIPGASVWAENRAYPAPESQTFFSTWKKP